MARAAVPGRLTWRLVWRQARLVEHRDETPTARAFVLEVQGWLGHLPGQHVDVRLTAEDGYSTQRSYSIASAADGERVEPTVQMVPDGEMSPYLTRTLSVGDPVEPRGPVGRWFVRRAADPTPVLLVGGGSGIVSLMAMVRARRAAGSRNPFRLIYSVRMPEGRYYADELRTRTRDDLGLDVSYVYTRAVPEGWPAARRHMMARAAAAGGGRGKQQRLAAGVPAGVLRMRADRLRGDGRRHPGGVGPRRPPGEGRTFGRVEAEAPWKPFWTTTPTATRWPDRCGRSSRWT